MHICEDMVGESVGDPPIPARGEGQVEVKPAQDKVQPAQDKKRERKNIKTSEGQQYGRSSGSNCEPRCWSSPRAAQVGGPSGWWGSWLWKSRSIITSSSLASPSSSPGLKAVPQEVQGKQWKTKPGCPSSASRQELGQCQPWAMIGVAKFLLWTRLFRWLQKQGRLWNETFFRIAAPRLCTVLKKPFSLKVNLNERNWADYALWEKAFHIGPKLLLIGSNPINIAESL